MVLGGNGAGLRPHLPCPGGHPADAHTPQAGRSVPPHHPVELSSGHGHPQDRPCHRRRLHHGAQAGKAHSVDLALLRPDHARRRPARGGPQRGLRLLCLRDLLASHGGFPSAEDLIHRFHPSRPEPPQGGRRQRPAHLDGAGRQRPLPRLRGRGPRRRRRGCHGCQDAQHRRSLHGREPLPRPRVDRRGVRLPLCPPDQ